MNEKFTYALENLSIFTPSPLEIIIGFILSLGCVFLMRWVFLYGYGYMMVRGDAHELSKKRNTLNDLILMKDIQTELEKEIEQAMLKATFQG